MNTNQYEREMRHRAGLPPKTRTFYEVLQETPTWVIIGLGILLAMLFT